MRLNRFAAHGIAAIVIAAAAPAHAQSTLPAVFVANNGNLEGSISSFTVNPDGTLAFADRIITGMRASTAIPEFGCNARAIAPGGRYLAIGHASGSSSVNERITILEVGADASLTLVQVFTVPVTPFDLVWMSDTVLAVARASTSSTNEIRTYLWDSGAETLTLADNLVSGGFSTSIDRHPTEPIAYIGDTGSGGLISSFAVAPDGTLTPLDAQPFGQFTLDIGVVNSGGNVRIYSGGGISAGGNAVVAADTDNAGNLAITAGSPFTSPGSSPKLARGSADGKLLVVGHGTDATVRTFQIDAETGALTSTGVSFDVGLQGSLDDVQVMGDLVLFTDNTTALDSVRGIYSSTLGPTGTLTQNGPIADTQGIAPGKIATWTPPAPDCPGDVNGDQMVDVDDLNGILSNWLENVGVGSPFDLANRDGVVNVDDLNVVLSNWLADCN